jgi:hypothetical protein
MKTETNHAYEYALLIKREILALETVAENWHDMVNNPEDIDGNLLEEITEALTELEREMPTDNDSDPIATYLNETALDVQVLHGANGRARIEILRTCGGPRCDITRDTDDGTVVEISVSDSGNLSVIRVNVETIADYLDMVATS